MGAVDPARFAEGLRSSRALSASAFRCRAYNPSRGNDAELVYIGITCDRTLKKRWYEFNRSAYERKNGHSEGWTFNSLYCGNEIAEAHPWLYVSCLPVRLED